MRFVLFILLAFFAIFVSSQMRRRGMKGHLVTLSIGPGTLQLVALVAAIMASLQTISLIEAGSVGVVKIFGMVRPEPLMEGINIRNPLADVVMMSIRMRERREIINIASQDGTPISLEMSVFFRLDPARAPEVLRTIGPGNLYIIRILIPNFLSVVRGVAAQFEAKAFYTSTEMRDSVSVMIREQLQNATLPHGIIIDGVVLRNVELP